jgi:putative transposase
VELACFTWTEDLMTDDRLPLAELLQKAGEADFLRTVAEAVLQRLMETDVDQVASPSPEPPERDNHTLRAGCGGTFPIRRC